MHKPSSQATKLDDAQNGITNFNSGRSCYSGHHETAVIIGVTLEKNTQ